MKITVNFKNIKSSDKLREYVEKKLRELVLDSLIVEEEN